jgi:hypothetical protein
MVGTSSTLAKNPNGYCPDHSIGVSCPIGLGVTAGNASPIEFA